MTSPMMSPDRADDVDEGDGGIEARMQAFTVLREIPGPAKAEKGALNECLGSNGLSEGANPCKALLLPLQD